MAELHNFHERGDLFYCKFVKISTGLSATTLFAKSGPKTDFLASMPNSRHLRL